MELPRVYEMAIECLRGAMWYGLTRYVLAEDSCIVDPKSTANGAQLHDQLGVHSGKGLQKTPIHSSHKGCEAGQRRRSGILIGLEIERGSPIFSPLFLSVTGLSLSL